MNIWRAEARHRSDWKKAGDAMARNGSKSYRKMRRRGRR
jgi:hypothetical protein